MLRTDLQFDYPDELIATSPSHPSRVMCVDVPEHNDNLITAQALLPIEISIDDLLSKPNPGDVWVVNETKVIKRRLFADDLEILFLQKLNNSNHWQVLFPSKKFSVGDKIQLPGNVHMTLVQKGRPQIVELSSDVSESYFDQFAEIPLPPYIQKARDLRHQKSEDLNWYQTAWAKKEGSLAAPTASLHFTNEQIAALEQKGVKVLKTTLHVGLGTFLPVTTENLREHNMHSEYVEVSNKTWSEIQKCKNRNGKVWCLGTTVVRSVESVARGMIPQNSNGDYLGQTQLLILPGDKFLITDVLMTNFHQPESTLLALVAAFAGLEQVKSCYEWAIQRKFRLFSYGDLSVWALENLK